MEPLAPFVTETWLRQNCKLEHGSVLQLPADAKLTPAAHGLLTDRKMQIKFGEDEPADEVRMPEATPALPEEPVSVSPQNIAALKESLKQELLAEIWKDLAVAKTPVRAVAVQRDTVTDGYSEGCCALCQQSVNEKTGVMTHAGSHILVAKNDFRLRLQGKLESALSQMNLLYAQLVAEACRNAFILTYLTDLHRLTDSVLKAVVDVKTPAKMLLAGLDGQAVENIACNPLKYLGRDHLYCDGTQGVRVAKLDVLRTHIREAELEAAAIYITHDFQMLRQDILSTLNQLSQAVYVLMLFVFLSEQEKT